MNLLATLWELRSFTFGDMNSSPSQAERTGSVEALARARRTVDEVKRSIGATLPAVNAALTTAGQAALIGLG